MRRSLLLLALAGLAAAFAAEPVRAQALAPAAGQPAELFPKPDRPVAEIVAPIWATERERDGVDEVGQVARLLGIGPGTVVADIGAGSGYYAVRLARRVGPEGRVFAEDVTPAYLAGLERRVRAAGLANVTVVRGEPHDPRLPPGSVDVALLVHMYHEASQPFGMLHNLAVSMRPGGRVGIVDLDDVPSRHGTPPALLRCELAAVGYREAGFHRLGGDVGYLAIFTPPAAADLPRPAEIRPCRDEATRARR